MASDKSVASLAETLRVQPLFLLPNLRYPTVVAFVEGFGMAGGVDMDGFREYLIQQLGGRDNPLHWSYMVLDLIGLQGKMEELSTVEENLAREELARQLAAFGGR